MSRSHVPKHERIHERIHERNPASAKHDGDISSGSGWDRHRDKMANRLVAEGSTSTTAASVSRLQQTLDLMTPSKEAGARTHDQLSGLLATPQKTPLFPPTPHSYPRLRSLTHTAPLLPQSSNYGSNAARTALFQCPLICSTQLSWTLPGVHLWKDPSLPQERTHPQLVASSGRRFLNLSPRGSLPKGISPQGDLSPKGILLPSPRVAM